MKHDPSNTSDPVYKTGYLDGFAARAKQPQPGVLVIGKLTLSRLASGQLVLTDGAAGTTPNEAQLEAVLRHVFENRWKPAVQIQRDVVVFES